MILFHNDYNEICHPSILGAMAQSAPIQYPGYGIDPYCERAADKIKKLCCNDNLSVHFLVGGTQTNLTVIAAALRPYQGVLCADSGHINVHETGAIEATGHKVLALPSADGKVYAHQLLQTVESQSAAMDAEHTVQPKMVYISNPTEMGTVYTLSELEQIHTVCKEKNLLLFLDGARLGYGLTAQGNDLTMADLARLCDVFYIGGTKVGAMFGEAVVISNPALAEDFRYMIKQRGGMLAKGWLLGLQFDVLFDNDLYFEISAHANRMAQQIRQTLHELNVPMLVETTTNQLFPILPDKVLTKLAEEFMFNDMGRVDDSHSAIRFCTSWATTQGNVEALCKALMNNCC